MTKKKEEKWKLPVKPFKIGSERLSKEFGEYVRYCQDFQTSYPTSRGTVVKYNKPRVPTVEEFCARLGIWATTLEEWRKKDWVDRCIGRWNPDVYEGVETYEAEVKALHKAANHVWHFIYQMKIAAVVNGDGNVGGLIFDMKVHYNKNDKQIVEHHQGNSIAVEILERGDDTHELEAHKEESQLEAHVIREEAGTNQD